MNNISYMFKDIMSRPTRDSSSYNFNILYYNLDGEYNDSKYNFVDIFNSISDYQIPVSAYSIVFSMLQYLYSKYYKYEIRFNCPYSFVNELYNKFKKVLKEYIKKVQIFNSIIELTDEELMLVETHYIAMANNNAVTNITAPLDNFDGYVDQQKGSKVKSNKIDKYMIQYSAIKEDILSYIINECYPLFIQVNINNKYKYMEA